MTSRPTSQQQPPASAGSGNPNYPLTPVRRPSLSIVPPSQSTSRRTSIGGGQTTVIETGRSLICCGRTSNGFAALQIGPRKVTTVTTAPSRSSLPPQHTPVGSRYSTSLNPAGAPRPVSYGSGVSPLSRRSPQIPGASNQRPVESGSSMSRPMMGHPVPPPEVSGSTAGAELSGPPAAAELSAQTAPSIRARQSNGSLRRSADSRRGSLNA